VKSQSWFHFRQGSWKFSSDIFFLSIFSSLGVQATSNINENQGISLLVNCVRPNKLKTVSSFLCRMSKKNGSLGIHSPSDSLWLVAENINFYLLNVVELFEEKNWIKLTLNRVKWLSIFSTKYPSLRKYYAVSLHEYLIQIYMYTVLRKSSVEITQLFEYVC
jgi:hypothetical protein